MVSYYGKFRWKRFRIAHEGERYIIYSMSKFINWPKGELLKVLGILLERYRSLEKEHAEQKEKFVGGKNCVLLIVNSIDAEKNIQLQP